MNKLVCDEYKIDYKEFKNIRIIGMEHGKNDIVFEFYKDNEEFIFSKIIYTSFFLAEKEMLKNYKNWINEYNRRANL